MVDTPRYRFGPLERRGVLLGLRRPQLAIISIGALSVILVLTASPSGRGIVVATVLVCAALLLSFVPLSGRTVDEWIPIALGWALTGITGRHRFVTARPTRGQTYKLDPQPDWPPALKGLVLLAAAAPGSATGIGVIKDRKAGSFTGVLRVRASSFALLDGPEKARRLAMWAGILAGLARENGVVHRIQWIESTIPDAGDEIGEYLKDAIAVPPAARSVRSYLDLVDEAGPVTQRHEVLIAVQVSAARSARAIKAAGGGDTGVCEVLRRELSSLSSRLMGADMDVEGALTPRLLAQAIRNGFDPLATPLGNGTARDKGSRGIAPIGAAPMATDVRWGSYRSDDVYHATYWIAEWPRIDVDPDFLSPLLLRTERMRTVSVVMEPVSPLKAIRSVERALTESLADEALRSRGGYLSTARRRREQQALEDHERDLSLGHAFFRFSGFVTVHGTTPEELDEACGEVEQAAGQAFLDLRRLYGQQEDALTWAALPLCRGLR